MCDNAELAAARGLIAGARCEAQAWEKHFWEIHSKWKAAHQALGESMYREDALRAEVAHAREFAKRADLLDFSTENIKKVLGQVCFTEDERLMLERAIKLDMAALYEGMLKVFEDLKVKMPEKFMELGLLG